MIDACLRAQAKEILSEAYGDVTDEFLDEMIDRSLQQMKDWTHRRFYVRQEQRDKGLVFRLVQEFGTPEGRLQRTWGQVGTWRGDVAAFWDDVAANISELSSAERSFIVEHISRFVPRRDLVARVWVTWEVFRQRVRKLMG